MKLCKFAIASLLLLLSTQSTVHAATSGGISTVQMPGVGNVGGIRRWHLGHDHFELEYQRRGRCRAATTFVAGDDVVFNAGDDNTNDGIIHGYRHSNGKLAFEWRKAKL